MSDDLDPVTAVAQDLAQIRRLSDDLEDQAQHLNSHPLMPGGPAMADLAPMANFEAFAHRLDVIEREHLATCGKANHRKCHVADHVLVDDEVLWLLWFWSGRWKVELGRETDLRPTVDTEAKFLATLVQWAYDHELHFDDFATDVASARRHLEELLRAGDPDGQAAVRCGHCGGQLVRRVDPRRKGRRCDGHGPLLVCPWPRRGCCDRGGYRDERECVTCSTRYSVAEYTQAVARDFRDNAAALSVDDLVRRFPGVTRGQVWTAASRGIVHRSGVDAYGRRLYDVADVALIAVSVQVLAT